MKTYQLVMFDWEGTLSDGRGAVLQSLKNLLSENGVEAFDEARARHYFSYDINALIDALYQDSLDTQKRCELKHLCLNNPISGEKLCLFDGATKVIDELKRQGVWLAVATGASRSALMSKLNGSVLETSFDALATADEYPQKPAPDMLNALLERFAVAPEDALMIGDSVVDLKAANLAGVDAIGFAPDGGEEALKAKSPIAVVDSYQALYSLLFN